MIRTILTLTFSKKNVFDDDTEKNLIRKEKRSATTATAERNTTGVLERTLTKKRNDSGTNFKRGSMVGATASKVKPPTSYPVFPAFIHIMIMFSQFAYVPFIAVMALVSLPQADARLSSQSRVEEVSTELFKDRNSTSLCERIHPNKLPPECICSEPWPYSLVIECDKHFNSTMFNDTIGMKIVINPCDPEGASVSIDVTELEHNIDYPISGIRANEEPDYPIPGLAVVVPGIGHIGMDVAVLVTGNLDCLTLKIGLNACVALAQKTICASSIPGLNMILPWYVLSGTYHFGDVCGNATFGALKHIQGGILSGVEMV